MKYRGLAIVAIALLVVGCCRLDQQATLTNLKNVVKISCENDAGPRRNTNVLLAP